MGTGPREPACTVTAHHLPGHTVSETCPGAQMSTAQWERSFLSRRCSRPHPRRDVSFLRPDGVRVDRGGGELRVSQPSLQQIQRYPGLDRRNPEPVPQALRCRLRPLDPGGLHHGDDVLPGGRPTEFPERGRGLQLLGRRDFLFILEARAPWLASQALLAARARRDRCRACASSTIRT